MAAKTDELQAPCRSQKSGYQIASQFFKNDARLPASAGNKTSFGPSFCLSAFFSRQAGGITLASSLPFTQAWAEDFRLIAPENLQQGQEFAVVSVIAVLSSISMAMIGLYFARRTAWRRAENALMAELVHARERQERAETFLNAERQVIVAWGAGKGWGLDKKRGQAGSGQPNDSQEPAGVEITGDVSLVSLSGQQKPVLAFGTWLGPDQAQALEKNIAVLREKGEGFHMALLKTDGEYLEAEGCAIAGRAVLRLRNVSQAKRDLIAAQTLQRAAQEQAQALRSLLEAIPDPAWIRDRKGNLTFVNDAYARAVEAKDSRAAVERRLELLDEDTRKKSALARSLDKAWNAQVPAIVAGARHMLRIVEISSEQGSCGIASDQSDLEAVRADLSQQMEAHVRTLDQLSTGVAIFDRSKKLVFHNAAYRQIWSLDMAFLDQKPSDSEILDQLRSDGRLAYQADFRAWKTELHSAYRALETIQQSWHLPDGRTLRSVITPNPQGGVTYLFDDITASHKLESEYNALVKVRSETLDTLREGVAVFGSNGRLKLLNPAFAKIWGIDQERLKNNPHIEMVAQACIQSGTDAPVWGALTSVVAGLHDLRTGFEQRLERDNGMMIDCTAAPLPDGGTLLTFTDVSASVHVERALLERNQALVEAERMRNEFVHHVSYELRSPLNSITGFLHMIGDPNVGPLNAKQAEYAGYVKRSSDALLAIINNILDLASIDSSSMELDVSDVDILEVIQEACEGVVDRLAETGMNLQIVALDNIGSFRADAKRVRQILFNLLSNAIGFSSPGQTVTVAALRRENEIVFKITDQGRGIPAEIKDRIFNRFETHTVGSRHRGPGLGLSIVQSFVELHKGRVLIDSAPGEGTVVTCIFPAEAVIANASEDKSQPGGKIAVRA